MLLLEIEITGVMRYVRQLCGREPGGSRCWNDKSALQPDYELSMGYTSRGLHHFLDITLLYEPLGDGQRLENRHLVLTRCAPFHGQLGVLEFQHKISANADIATFLLALREELTVTILCSGILRDSGRWNLM